MGGLQAIHPNKGTFREWSLENGMLPCLGRCFHDSSLEKLGFWTTGGMVFMTRVLKRRRWWVVWKKGFRDSNPEKQAIHPKKGSFWESSPENGMLPHLGRCFHDSSPEKLGSRTWGWMVFMTRVLKRSGGGWFGKVAFVTPILKNRRFTLRRGLFGSRVLKMACCLTWGGVFMTRVLKSSDLGPRDGWFS